LAVERIAESKKDQELAAYHKVKAMKELEGMDIEHIEKLVNIVQILKEKTMQTNEEESIVKQESQETLGTPEQATSELGSALPV